jgi:hypothetical protein
VTLPFQDFFIFVAHHEKFLLQLLHHISFHTKMELLPYTNNPHFRKYINEAFQAQEECGRLFNRAEFSNHGKNIPFFI